MNHVGEQKSVSVTTSELESETLRHRNIGFDFESEIVFLIHLLIYIDFDEAIRVRDSGSGRRGP